MTVTPRRILVALDLEGRAHGAAHFAPRLAARFGARLDAVHVASALKRPTLTPFAMPDDQTEEHFARALSQLPEVDREAVKFHRLTGNPVERLTDLVSSESYELLVLGAPSEGLRHRILGGTTRDVLHQTTVPVLICQGEVAPDATTRIVVAIDQGATSAQVFPVAVSWAKVLGAKLECLFVFEPPSFAYDPASAVGASTIDHLRDAEFQLFRDFLARQDLRGVPHEVFTEEGQPAEVIRAHCDRSPSILVMGTHGRTGLKRLLMGSVAEAVLAQTKAPVLLLRS